MPHSHLPRIHGILGPTTASCSNTKLHSVHAGDQVDRIYINTYETDVRFCNGTPTHLELMPRQGFRDLHALSPLITEPDEAASFVSLGPAEASRSVR